MKRCIIPHTLAERVVKSEVECSNASSEDENLEEEDKALNDYDEDGFISLCI
jgi:hypothetical protein